MGGPLKGLVLCLNSMILVVHQKTSNIFQRAKASFLSPQTEWRIEGQIIHVVACCPVMTMFFVKLCQFCCTLDKCNNRQRVVETFVMTQQACTKSGTFRKFWTWMVCLSFIHKRMMQHVCGGWLECCLAACLCIFCVLMSWLEKLVQNNTSWFFRHFVSP